MQKPRIMNHRISTLSKFVGCVLLAFLAADLQAQLLFKTKFLPVESYTNGWIIGQPSIGNKWENSDWSDEFGGQNTGQSWWRVPDGGGDGVQWNMATATNWSGTKWAMMIASDGNQGTNTAVYFWRMPFPNQMVGPVTVEWDWQYFPTNPIPANFDATNRCPITEGGQALPCTNDAGLNLQTTDVGFCLSDKANKDNDGNPNVVFNENSCITRLGGDQVADSRFNAVDSATGGIGGGSGDWFKRGPRYQDGKSIHEIMRGYIGLTGDAAGTNNTFAVWSWRQGEAAFQTANPLGDENYGLPDNPKPMPQFGMRRNPGEVDPASGLNCIQMWMNSSADKIGTYVLFSNIRVTGRNAVPVPTLSIANVAGNVQVTFTGWLEAADDPAGPYTTVAVTTYPYTTPTVYNAPAGTKKFYRASM